MKRELMMPFSMGEVPSKRARLGVIEYSQSLSSLNIQNEPKLTENNLEVKDEQAQDLHITQNDNQPQIESYTKMLREQNDGPSVKQEVYN